MQSNSNSAVPENGDKKNVNVLLQAGLQAILDVPRLRKLKSAFTDLNLQISIDLKAIEDKIAKRVYATVDEFVADLKRMQQNSSDDLFPEKQLLKSFKNFVKYCEFDLKLIKSCAECYWNELMDKTDGWFTEVCSKPHSVVMVKLARSYVPAKVLCFDKKKVFVRLFEELCVADIPYGARIQLYTKFSVQKTTRGSLKAIEAANTYIENVIKKFGCYNYGDIRTTTATLTVHRLSQHLRYLTSPEMKQQEIGVDDRIEERMAKRVKLDSRPDSEDEDGDIDVISTVGSVRDDRRDIENDSVECVSTLSTNTTAARLACQSTVSSGTISDDYSDSDVLSTVGSVRDDRRDIENDYVEYVPTLSTNTAAARRSCNSSVHIQRMTSSTTIAVQSTNSPPVLRDCSSRCGFSSKSDEIRALQNELEKIKSDHQIEISSMTKSYGEMMKQMRRQHEVEQAEIVQETKTKQWCANCWQEAKLYCCWQTSYCDDFCQRKHWLQHSGKCLNEQSLLERDKQ